MSFIQRLFFIDTGWISPTSMCTNISQCRTLGKKKPRTTTTKTLLKRALWISRCNSRLREERSLCSFSWKFFLRVLHNCPTKFICCDRWDVDAQWWGFELVWSKKGRTLSFDDVMHGFSDFMCLSILQWNGLESREFLKLYENVLILGEMRYGFSLSVQKIASLVKVV